jgi:excisionase family DNA binding protein
MSVKAGQPQEEVFMTKLLTVQEAADQLGTSVRFVRRLIAERRIAYVRVGRHVRIAEADLASFVAAGRVDASA